MPAPSPVEVLAEELGAVAGRIEREASLRIGAAIAELRRIDAERELRLQKLEAALERRIESIKDGRDGIDGKDGAPGEKGLDGKDGRDGIDGKDGAPGEKGLDGKDGRDGIDGKDGAPGEKGLDGKDGAPGLLPLAKAYEERVYYAGEVAVHLGATWQATRDTGRAPPHEDWICLASAGSAGRSPRVRETYDAAVADYAELDIVALNGAAFIARRDNPGPCPGDGWQLIAMRGKPGERMKGDPGPRGPKVERMNVDGQGLLTLVNADGSTVECDLYPVLAKLQR